jgi:hypothetical protein
VTQRISIEGEFPVEPARCWYFGCGRDMGHFLYGPNALTDPTLQPPAGCPWNIGHMDCGLLKNGRHPDKPDGRVFFTLARNDWHAFFWWDRSIDRRGASNSGFYVQGFRAPQYRTAFEHACATFPMIVARQQLPLVLQDKDFLRE